MYFLLALPQRQIKQGLQNKRRSEKMSRHFFISWKITATGAQKADSMSITDITINTNGAIQYVTVSLPKTKPPRQGPRTMSGTCQGHIQQMFIFQCTQCTRSAADRAEDDVIPFLGFGFLPGNLEFVGWNLQSFSFPVCWHAFCFFIVRRSPMINLSPISAIFFSSILSFISTTGTPNQRN